jgi:hypothetical protein
VAAIPQIIKRIRDFSEVIAETIEPIGIVVTKYQANSHVHVNILSPENAPLGANIAQGVDCSRLKLAPFSQSPTGRLNRP